VTHREIPLNIGSKRPQIRRNWWSLQRNATKHHLFWSSAFISAIVLSSPYRWKDWCVLITTTIAQNRLTRKLHKVIQVWGCDMPLKCAVDLNCEMDQAKSCWRTSIRFRYQIRRRGHDYSLSIERCMNRSQELTMSHESSRDTYDKALQQSASNYLIPNGL
jgi:hypothetical protein